MLRIKNNFNRGISLVEVIVGSAIVLFVVLAVVQTYNIYISFALGNQNNTRANFLLEEGVETLIYLRDDSWTSNISSLTNDTTYYLYFNGSTWTSTTTPQYIDTDFLRSFVLESVNRDSNDDIAVSGSIDTNIKKATVTVSYWQGHATTTKSISTYITNLYAN
jgi:hypothetical protein